MTLAHSNTAQPPASPNTNGALLVLGDDPEEIACHSTYQAESLGRLFAAYYASPGRRPVHTGHWRVYARGADGLRGVLLSEGEAESVHQQFRGRRHPDGVSAD